MLPQTLGSAAPMGWCEKTQYFLSLFMIRMTHYKCDLASKKQKAGKKTNGAKHELLLNEDTN